MVIHYRIQMLRGELEELNSNGIKPNFSELSRIYGLDRHTIAKYYKEGKIKMSPKEGKAIYDKYFEEIKQKAQERVCSKKALFMYFRNKYGDKEFACYSTFAHYLQRKEIRKQIDLTIHLRYETEPGWQLQLDWKEDLHTVLKNGEVIEYNLFVATFGYSRFHYYIYSKTKTTNDFLRCLIECLHRAGGKPGQLITDNMSAVVTITGGTKNKLPIIKQFEKDLGVKIHLCKVRTPQTKGKAESANRFVQWLAPYDHDLNSEDELIQLIQKFNSDVNNEINETTGIPPVKLMGKEMEHLQPLPNKILIDSYIENVLVQTVPSTLLVPYKGCQYSVPGKFIGKKVKLIPIDNKLYIYSNTQLITIHDIENQKFNYHKQDYIEGLRQSMPSDIADSEIEQRAIDNLALLGQIGGNGDE